jgi:hypothetical protein
MPALTVLRVTTAVLLAVERASAGDLRAVAELEAMAALLPPERG